MQARRRKEDIRGRRSKVVKKIIKIPEYSEEDIKEIEKEFDKEEGWVSADEVFGEEREVESFFISIGRRGSKSAVR